MQLSRAGKLAPFSSTPDCVLAENALAEYLSSLDLEFFQAQEASVHDPATSQILHTHRRLIIGQQFPLEWAPNIYVAGDWIFLLGGEHVYVSAGLKNKLAESSFTYLEFHEGLSGLPDKG
ncbi:MAG TPA: hypothetical protein VK629_17910 [Steroidobacteraceae bacterium]|nr:hypothetical protein [Steroidobacteraceae bacterium]